MKFRHKATGAVIDAPTGEHLASFEPVKTAKPKTGDEAEGKPAPRKRKAKEA